ncbi:MAG: hypothetical protein K6F34_07400 [Lachnospiraceae bacterium]|nr:hypothetical protein [Lachnospiraceae bacterium]
MEPLTAVYVRMKVLLGELEKVSEELAHLIQEFEAAASRYVTGWEGTAYEQYGIRLKKDMDYMKSKTLETRMMCTLLYSALSGYQRTEFIIWSILGGMTK